LPQVPLDAIVGDHERRHLGDTQAAVGGTDVILGVAQAGDERDIERAQEVVEGLIDQGPCPHPVGDDADAQAVLGHATECQQLLEKARRRTDVDRRRQHRYQYGLRRPGQLLERLAGDAGRGIDHQHLAAAREFQLFTGNRRQLVANVVLPQPPLGLTTMILRIARP